MANSDLLDMPLKIPYSTDFRASKRESSASFGIAAIMNLRNQIAFEPIKVLTTCINMQQYCIIMQDKQARQELIKELVEKYPVRTQTELQNRLSQAGVLANQATLSRDIKELGLYKTSIEGEQRYVIPETQTTTTKPITGLSRFVQSVAFSLNTIVLKTDSGAASHVAEYLDTTGLNEILGTIAGDNTIFIVVKETAKAKDTAEKLKSLFSL
ncbi:arginine repressor [bacterium]|nr:arginine repressor [bacterium]